MKILLAVVGAYALLVLLVYLFQDRMLYLPELAGRALTATPAELALPFEDVMLETADGERLHGWYVPGKGSAALLFFHGNAGNISHRLASIRQFHNLGLAVFIIDYRGFGRSSGRPGEAGTYEDAQTAWNYLSKRHASNQIVVFGRSLGGPVAAWLAARQTPAALIVESAFTSVPDAAQELYPFLPVRWISRFSYATEDYARRVNCPVLVIHSRQDEIIPFHHGQAIYAAAPQPRHLLELDGSHNTTFMARGYTDGLRTFLGQHLRLENQ